MTINKIPAKHRQCYKISRNDLKLGSYHLAESVDLGIVQIDNPDTCYQAAVELFDKIYNDIKEINFNG